MENLSKQDLFQIIEFYKTKVSQQELSYLILQLETNNKIKSLNDKIDSDTADYLLKLEMKFSHYIQILHIKPYLQTKFLEKTGLNIWKLKTIKKIMIHLNNPFLPKYLKQFLVIITYFHF